MEPLKLEFLKTWGDACKAKNNMNEPTSFSTNCNFITIALLFWNEFYKRHFCNPLIPKSESAHQSTTCTSDRNQEVIE